MDPSTKPRLHRLDRLFTSEPIYFLTLCTAQRKTILAIPEVHETFKAFAIQGQRHGVPVGRYVIMPDHIHLFAAFPARGLSLSLWVKSLKNTMSRSLRMQNVATPHWQKGFFDHVLRSSESYAVKWEYVRLSPVRARLVRKVESWPYQGEICRLSGQDLG